MKKIYIMLLFFGLSTLAFGSVATFVEVAGSVDLLRAGKSIEVFKDGVLEEKDIVQTNKNSSAKIEFEDNTIVTLGQGTIFKIEEYLFDDKNSQSNLKVNEGLFRVVTGKIGKINPERFKLQTRNATIGIRGTQIVGSTSEDRDIIECVEGAINVCNAQGCEDLTAGEFTIVNRDLPPTRGVSSERKEQDTNEQEDGEDSSDNDETLPLAMTSAIVDENIVLQELSKELSQTPESVIEGFISNEVEANYYGFVTDATKGGLATAGGDAHFVFKFGDPGHSSGEFNIGETEFLVHGISISPSGWSVEASNISVDQSFINENDSSGITGGAFLGSNAEKITGNIDISVGEVTQEIYTGTISATK